MKLGVDLLGHALRKSPSSIVGHAHRWNPQGSEGEEGLKIHGDDPLKQNGCRWVFVWGQLQMFSMTDGDDGT